MWWNIRCNPSGIKHVSKTAHSTCECRVGGEEPAHSFFEAQLAIFGVYIAWATRTRDVSPLENIYMPVGEHVLLERLTSLR